VFIRRFIARGKVKRRFRPPRRFPLLLASEPIHGLSVARIVTRNTRTLVARTILVASIAFLANQSAEFAALSSLSKKHADAPGWDAGWYAEIIRRGYDPASKVERPFAASAGLHPKHDAANWAFFPLFPTLARPFGAIFGLSATVAAVTAGKIFFYLAIIAFVELSRRYRPDIHPAIPAMVAGLNPYSFYANVGYTEPLFLLLTSIFFIELHRHRYVGAGLAGALLTASRFVGLSAALAYAVACVIKAPASARKSRETRLLGFLMIPLGVACFMLFLHWRTGDALAFLHVQRAWGRSPNNPIETLAIGLTSGIIHQYFSLSSIAALVAPLVLVRQRHYELATFSWICTLAPLSTGLLSMPRFIWWQAPLLLLVSGVFAWRKSWLLLLPVFLVALVITTRLWLLRANWLV